MLKKGVFYLLLCSLIMLTSVTSKAEQPTFRIGMTVSMTGPFSQEVGPFKNLIKAWENNVNQKGGINIGGTSHRLEIIVYDDCSDQNTTRTSYERLIRANKVNLLMGPYSSPLTFVASIPAEENNIPFIAICGNSPKIYERDFKWLLGILDLAPNYTKHYWDLLKHENFIKTVAFVVEDSMHPKSVYNGSKELATSYGFNIVQEDIVATDTQDFSSLILKLKNKKPDLIFVSANVHFASAFMRQAKERGLEAKEFHCIHHSGVFRKAVGDFAENVTGQMYWVKGMKTPGSEEFVTLLEQANIDPYDYPWASAYFAAFQTVEQALKQSQGISNSQILSSLKAKDYDTLCGKNSFEAKGHGRINPMPAQIQQGTYQIMWPESMATSQHKYRSQKASAN